MARRTAVALVMVSMALLGACGDDDTSTAGTTPPAHTDVSVEGRTFLSTGVTGKTIVDGTRIRLGFAGGRVSAQAGCNSMSGQYTLASGVLQVSGGLMQTEMGCEQPLMDQDAWVGSLLTSSPTVSFDGDSITITGTAGTSDAVTLTLQDREVADPDRPLDGTTWSITGIIEGDSASSTIEGATVVFADGKVQVVTGCNQISGAAVIGEGTIEAGPLGSTKMGCPPDVAQLESAVAATFDGRIEFTIEAGSLTLTGPNGTGLMLTAP